MFDNEIVELSVVVLSGVGGGGDVVSFVVVADDGAAVTGRIRLSLPILSPNLGGAETVS